MAGLFDQLYGGNGSGVLPDYAGDTSFDPSSYGSWLDMVGATPQGIQSSYGDQQQTADQQPADQQTADQGSANTAPAIDMGPPETTGGGILGAPPATAAQGFGEGLPQPGGGGLLGGLANRLTNPLVLMGLGLASGRTPQEGFGGAMKGLMAGQQYAQQQQAQQLLYNAAIAQGVDPKSAAALAMNPQAASLLMPQIKMMTGPLGETSIVAVSPLTGKMTPLAMGGGGGAGGTSTVFGALDQLPPQYDANGRDQNYLDAISKQYGATVAKSVQDIADGKFPATGRNLQKLLPLASRYSQNFTGAQDYKAYQQAINDFAPGGKDNTLIARYNQAMNHTTQLWNLIDKLPNTNIGGWGGHIINPVVSGTTATLDPKTANVIKRKNELGQALAGELMNASRQSGRGSEREIRDWKAGFDAANSKDEMRGSLQGAMDFLSGAIESTAEKKNAWFRDKSVLTPGNEAVFNKIRSYVPGQPTSLGTGNQTSAPAQTGRPSRAEIEAEMRRRGLLQ